MNNQTDKLPDAKPKNGIWGLLKPYRGTIALLISFALLSNALSLVIPKIISNGIDSYIAGHYGINKVLIQFLLASGAIFLFTWLQTVVQTYASERVALDLRKRLADKISEQSFEFIQKSNPSKLLTNLTSDMDSIKMFVSQAVTSIVSSIFIIIGTSILLLIINWRLAIPVIAMVPAIGIVFFLVLKKVKVLFKRSREIVDWLNKVINESIVGSAIIRVVNSSQLEYKKFLGASAEARDLGVSILNFFAVLIPVIMLLSSLATLAILGMGGHYVINGSLTLGEFTAFNSYVIILIFPIMIIGFMSNVIAQATASYDRIERILNAPPVAETGVIENPLEGNIVLEHISVWYDEKPALKDISLSIQAGTRTAIIGPTAAGKTQLLYLLTGLLRPSDGKILFDGIEIDDYRKELFQHQIGFVFQDSLMFNLTLRENIAFSDTATDEDLAKAIATAELKDFVDSLPEKLNTIVSERGTSLSGGQKQRIMLARALALNPSILLLDDFTARVDQQTEQNILRNIRKNYPKITLISVTQKITTVTDFDQIVLLMEGEIAATGKHDALIKESPEYVQIYNSQRSANHYEIQS